MYVVNPLALFSWWYTRTFFFNSVACCCQSGDLIGELFWEWLLRMSVDEDLGEVTLQSEKRL